MADRPAWMRAVIRVERAIGVPLQQAANSRRGARMMLAVTRGAGSARAKGERVRSGAVHLLWLPSHGDVKRLTVDVARLQQAVEEITHRLDERIDGVRS
jgi:hypothetical protein